MSIVPPDAGEPRRPSGPRDPGDAWVVAPDGTKYWGRFGAAGLLALDATRGVLLQHRVEWSHFGDTWALPGGARHEGESARDGALREAAEEAGVPPAAIRPRLMSLFDLGYWSYATLVGDVSTPFEAQISDPESRALEWVPVDAVAERPLHPGFAASWAGLRPLLSVRPVVLVDAANVVGSVPDGWWRDRAGAAERLLARVAVLAAGGVVGEGLGVGSSAGLGVADGAGDELNGGHGIGVGVAGGHGVGIGVAAATWFPQWVVVLEGAARAARAVEGVDAVRAPASGDDTLVAEAVRLVAAGQAVSAVTSDRALAARLTAAGADVRGARWLLGLLGD